jgi:hypothetical protein
VTEYEADDNIMSDKVEAIKVQDFWTHNPVGWFVFLEAQFLVRTPPVPQLNRFLYALAGLPSNILELASDITSVPPNDDSYQNLKDMLLEKYQKSALDKSFLLLNFVDGGELTPLESMAKVNRLFTTNHKKALWLRTLEPELRNTITGDQSSALKELATKADQILKKNLANSARTLPTSRSWTRRGCATSTASGASRPTCAEELRVLWLAR